MRYQRLGIIKKRKGLQSYEYIFNDGLLSDGVTEVFILKKPKKETQQDQSSGREIAEKCEYFIEPAFCGRKARRR